MRRSTALLLTLAITACDSPAIVGSDAHVQTDGGAPDAPGPVDAGVDAALPPGF